MHSNPDEHLAKRVEFEKLWRFVGFAHLHRRHINLGSDISGCDKSFVTVLVAGRTPELVCGHVSRSRLNDQTAITSKAAKGIL